MPNNLRGQQACANLTALAVAVLTALCGVGLAQAQDVARSTANKPFFVQRNADGSAQVIKLVPPKLRRTHSNVGAAWVNSKLNAAPAALAARAANAAALAPASLPGASWTPLVNPIPDANDPQVTPGASLVLTNGTVLVQDAGTADW